MSDRAARMPGFAAPPAMMDSPSSPPPETPAELGPTQELPTVPPPAGRPSRFPRLGPPTRDDRPRTFLRAPGDPTRTDTSSGHSPIGVDLDVSRETSQDPRSGTPKPEFAVSRETLIGAGVAVVGILAMGAGLAVRWRTRGQRMLRRPTADQVRNVGKPIGRILSRRVSLLRGENANDFVDMLAAIAGMGDYVNEGPLTEANPQAAALATPAMTMGDE
jgi:hypothetical protein